MKTYYKVSWGRTISPIEVEKETENSVWIKGVRQNKKSTHASYYQSYEEAYNHIKTSLEKSVKGCEFRLNEANKTLNKGNYTQIHAADIYNTLIFA